MMRKIILTLVFFNLIHNSFSQDFRITGQVTDSTGQSIPGAGISIIQSRDSALIAGTVSGANGNFILNNVSPGKIFLKISFLGYNDLYIKKEIANQSLNLGKLYLQNKAST